MALSNTVLGVINFVAVLLSVPIIAAGIWLALQTDNSCVKLLQWPVIVVGVIILLIALAGFIGAIWRIPSLLFFYLVVMLFAIILLAVLVVFIYAVTINGHGHHVPGRVYMEYRLEDYSGWLRRRVQSSHKWNRIKACLTEASFCSHMNQSYQSPQIFFIASISPLQSGCCKPPTACGYTFVNPTNWISPINYAADTDCFLWSNEPQVLCYLCSSCKAGLLANLKSEWRKADIILLVTLVALIGVYLMGCCAFRNARTDELFRRYKQGYS